MVGLVLYTAAPNTSAHGGAYLVVEPTTISPNGEGSVRGAGFGVGDTVTLVLVTSTGELPLGSVDADGEGSFSAVVRLPPDVADGSAHIEARSTDHVESADLTIAGADPDDEDEGRRDEEEPLLAPLPSMPTSSTPADGAPAVPRASSVPAQASGPATAPSLAILIGVGIALLLVAIGGAVAAGRRSRRRRTGASVPDSRSPERGR